jgi:pimeloyl-ACP methyl ester carboxylesterase
VFRDAEDLYRAMEMAWEDGRGRRTATGFALAGYSLGGFNAAFVAHLDDQRKTFDFDKVLLINPPVNLYNSISLLDRMIENIPGGEDNFDEFFNKVITVFTDVYKREQDAVGFGEDFLAKVFQAYQPRDEELAALIGLSFRLSSGSMIFTTDVITDYGFIKPRGYRIGRYEGLTKFRQTAYRIGFTDFYHEFFYPFYASEYPGMDRDGFIETMSLHSIADYLRGAEHIEVIHNRDDVILAPGEINFFPEVFGERAKIYPYGGHLGNMEYRENVEYMVGVFR